MLLNLVAAAWPSADRALLTGLLHAASASAAQGRVLFDAFIYNDVAAMPGEEPGYLLDVDADLAAAVTTHLKRFRLRSKVCMRMPLPPPADCK